MTSSLGFKARIICLWRNQTLALRHHKKYKLGHHWSWKEELMFSKIIKNWFLVNYESLCIGLEIIKKMTMRISYIKSSMPAEYNSNPVVSPASEVSIPALLGHSTFLNQKLMAPPAVPHVSGLVTHASGWWPKSIHSCPPRLKYTPLLIYAEIINIITIILLWKRIKGRGLDKCCV